MTLAAQYGPWALIAGASEGTGRAFALELASQGVHCILVARREEPLQALAELIHSNHDVECVTAAIDLSMPSALEQVISAAGDRQVGLFISNAGADPNGARFLDQGVDAWTGQINRNVLTMVRCCHHFGSAMRERKRGGILLVGSGSCYGGASFMAVYSGTKAFDLCFGEGLWAELRDHGVHVLNLILGRTDTPAFRKLLAEKGQPVPPGLASPEDVASVGLAKLPHGPIHNWGQEEDDVGFAPTSAAARRARIVALDSMTKDIFGE